MNWEKLQNGSDIRGVAVEGYNDEKVNLTPHVAEKLGMAFVTWLKKRTENSITVAVGTDSRISGPSLKEAFIKGLRLVGAKVYDCGMASTPAMFMTTVAEENPVTAGVMITASHLPYNRNGMKFFTGDGGLNKEEITEIINIAASDLLEKSMQPGALEERNFIDEYSQFLVNYIRKSVVQNNDFNKPLDGVRIIVDAGNGAGGFFATKVLQPLGADILGSQFLEPDGMFPNHVPNPEDKDAMNSICDAVKKHKADLGVIFDTDVDRSAVVDRNGNPVNRNALIALIGAIILKEHPGSTIVTDSVTSDGLSQFIEQKLEGKHHRFKRGYKNVINEAIRLNSEGTESWLAIETSGHAALKENFFLDDGAFLVAKILVEMAKLKTEGKELTSLIDSLEQPVESKELRFNIVEKDFVKYGNEVLSRLSELVNEIADWEIVKPNYEGIRVRCAAEKGWFLLRLSLHDPVMPVNVESNTEDGVSQIIRKLKPLLIRFEGLDLDTLMDE